MTMPSSRIEREFLKFQEVSPSEVAVKTLAVDDRFIVQFCDTVTDATVLNAATTGLAADVDHKEGQYSIEWDKVLHASLTTAGVTFAPSSLNLSRYSDGKLKYWIYISDLTNVASCSIVIGTSETHNLVFTTLDSALSAGWNELSHDVDSPTSTTGNGCIWGDIDYVAVYVTFDVAANALADMRLDAISVSNPVRVSLDGATITTTGAVTVADGAAVTLGAKADAKSTATDTTPVTAMQVLKEISYMEQNPASRAVTNAGTFAVQAACTNAGTFAVQSAPAAATSGGADTLFDSDADNTAQAIKGAAGQLYKLDVYNSNAAVAFVQLFDLAVGDVTVGVTAPKYVIYVPAQGAATIDFDMPMAFATAISYACATTATGAGDPTVGLTLSACYK